MEDSIMKKNRFILLAVLSVAAAVSCSKEVDMETPELPGEKGNKTLVFTAHVAKGSSTKTSLNGVNVVWSEEDQIDAYVVIPEFGTSRERSFQTEVTGDGSIAKFSFNNYGEAWGMSEYEGLQLTWYAAYSPFLEYDGEDNFDEVLDAIPVQIPSLQYVPEGGGFADGANVAVAYVSDPDNLYFRNAGGLVAVKIKGAAGHEIETICISGTEQGGGAMTGLAQVKVSEANAITSVACSGTDYVMLAKMDGAPMDLDDVYYAVVAPGTYTDVTIRFTDKDGLIATYQKKTDLVVTSNSNQLIGGFDIPESKWTKDNIIFADANVKALLVSKFDTDSDGEISHAEAEVVTSFDGLFSDCGVESQEYSDEKKPVITSFDEFQFFTGMTSLEANAFIGCDRLASIVLPTSLTEIGKKAFSGGKNLSSIAIPDQVEIIEEYLFWGCDKLSHVSLPDGLKSIGQYAFVGAAFTSIEIPETIESIGEYAFASCSLLQEFQWPETITRVERGTFSGCYDLAAFDFTGIESIGPEAFRSTGLTEIQWPRDLETGELLIQSIGSLAFMSCHIETLDYPEVWDMGIGVFEHCNFLKEINFPEEVSEIVERTFAECYGLESINIPGTIWGGIGTRAFYRCSYLKNVTLSDGIGGIGDEAFAECTQLKSITIPGSVSRIGEKAFYKCNGLVSVIMNDLTPEEEEEYGDEVAIIIGKEAFAECSRLNSFDFPSHLKDIGDRAFTKTGFTKVSLADVLDLSYLGYGAFSYCSSLREFDFHEFGDDNWNRIDFGDGAFEHCEQLASITLPEGVWGIPVSCFDGCIRLESIDLPKTVFYIENYSFRDCALTSLTIPGELMSIAGNPFLGCSSLTSITLLIQEPVFENYYLADNVFAGISDSFRIYVPANLVEDYKSNMYWGVYADRIEAIPAEP